jgi:hypothetical protein
LGGGGHPGSTGGGGGYTTTGGGGGGYTTTGGGGGGYTTTGGGGGDAGTGHGFSHSLHIVHDVWSLDTVVVVVFVVDVAKEKLECKMRRRVKNESNIFTGFGVLPVLGLKE